ncbi:MAG TPA: outer membrane beta-barrel protein [Rhizomicrobium sp.]
MRILKLVAVLGLVCLWPLRASADDFGPYLAADYDFVSAGGITFQAYDGGAGFHLNRYLDLEAGYVGSQFLPVRFNGGYVDAYANWRFREWNRVSLFGTIGAEYVSIPGDVSSFGVRAGAGLEYGFSHEFRLRVGARYQTAIQSGLIVNVGFSEDL